MIAIRLDVAAVHVVEVQVPFRLTPRDELLDTAPVGIGRAALRLGLDVVEPLLHRLPGRNRAEVAAVVGPEAAIHPHPQRREADGANPYGNQRTRVHDCRPGPSTPEAPPRRSKRASRRRRSRRLTSAGVRAVLPRLALRECAAAGFSQRVAVGPTVDFALVDEAGVDEVVEVRVELAVVDRLVVVVLQRAGCRRPSARLRRQASRGCRA